MDASVGARPLGGTRARTRLAEAASRAKDDFLAMMSHEIRTPMNGVLGLVEVLERTPLNADQGEMLGMIHESAGALLQILDDLLDYSKIEAGRLTIEAEPIDMRDLVDNAVGLLAGPRARERAESTRGYRARSRGQLARRQRAAAADSVQSARQCDQVHAEGRGRRAVSRSSSRRAGAQTLEMTVKTPASASRRRCRRVFSSRSCRRKSSTTRRFGGTGLGLTICRKLIALMGGALELRSARWASVPA